MFSLSSILVVWCSMQGLVVSAQHLEHKHKKASKHAPRCKDNPYDWEDILKNECSWYDEYPEIRCAWAKYLKKDHQDARTICCACGGGRGPPADTPTPSAVPSAVPSATPSTTPSFTTSSPLPSMMPTPSPTRDLTKFAKHIYSPNDDSYIGYKNGQLKQFNKNTQYTQIAIVPVRRRRSVGLVRLKFMNTEEDTFLTIRPNGSVTVHVGELDRSISVFLDTTVFRQSSLFVDGVNMSTFKEIAVGDKFFLEVKDGVLTTTERDVRRGTLFNIVDLNEPTASPSSVPSFLPSPVPTSAFSPIPSVDVEQYVRYIYSEEYETFLGFRNVEIQQFDTNNDFTHVAIIPVYEQNHDGLVRLKFVNAKNHVYLRLKSDGTVTIARQIDSSRNTFNDPTVFRQTTLWVDRKNLFATFQGVAFDQKYLFADEEGGLSSTENEANVGVVFRIFNLDELTEPPSSLTSAFPSPVPSSVPSIVLSPAPSADIDQFVNHIYSEEYKTYIGFKNETIQQFDTNNNFTHIAIIPVYRTRPDKLVRLKFVNSENHAYIRLKNDGSVTFTRQVVNPSKNVFKDPTVFRQTSLFVDREYLYATFQCIAFDGKFYLSAEEDGGVSSSTNLADEGVLFSIFDPSSISQLPSSVPSSEPSLVKEKTFAPSEHDLSLAPSFSPSYLVSPIFPVVVSHIKSNNDGTYIGFKNDRIRQFSEKNEFTKIEIVPVLNSTHVEVRLKFINPVVASFISLGDDASIEVANTENDSTNFIYSKILHLENSQEHSHFYTFNGIVFDNKYFLAVINGRLSTTDSVGNRAMFVVESDDEDNLPDYAGDYFIKHIKSGGYMTFYDMRAGVYKHKNEYEHVRIISITGTNYYALLSLYYSNAWYLTVENDFSVGTSTNLGSKEYFEISDGTDGTILIKHVESGLYLNGPADVELYRSIGLTENSASFRAKFLLESIPN